MVNCVLCERTCSVDSTSCTHCGWNAEEVERRKKLFSEKGLTLCKNGLQGLIITRDENKKSEE